MALGTFVVPVGVIGHGKVFSGRIQGGIERADASVDHGAGREWSQSAGCLVDGISTFVAIRRRHVIVIDDVRVSARGTDKDSLRTVQIGSIRRPSRASSANGLGNHL